jgi:Uncharacterized protein conserved in bacteria (DUF2344)
VLPSSTTAAAAGATGAPDGRARAATEAPRSAEPAPPTEAAPATEVAPEAGSASPPEPPPPAEPRQRWRLTFARDPVPADEVGRAVLDAWQETLAGSGLPLAGLDIGGGGRARIVFAAPLPAAARGEAELADLWLLERRPTWAVREALADRLPGAHRWISAEDVWLGAPALAGQVVAADWHIEIAGRGLDRDRIADAARRLIAAGTLPRTRLKGATVKRYDLRPLLADIAIEDHAARPVTDGSIVMHLRTRIHPELGAGRPEEVIAALAESANLAIDIGAMTRLRLLLGDELPAARRR